MTAHAIASNRTMPNLPIIEPPTEGGWIAPGLTAAAGVMGTWIVQWFRNRGQSQRRIDDRFAKWQESQTAEIERIHSDTRAKLEAIEKEMGDLRERLTVVTTFAVAHYIISTQLARAVKNGQEAIHLADAVLEMKPPEFLQEEK